MAPALGDHMGRCVSTLGVKGVAVQAVANPCEQMPFTSTCACRYLLELGCQLLDTDHDDILLEVCHVTSSRCLSFG